MTDGSLRSLLEEHWAALEAEQATAEHRLRVSELPVVTAGGPLAIAVDHDGYRHVLVPIPAHRKIRPGMDGPVLRLRKQALEDEETYQTYTDLACLRGDLNDLFTGLCADVLGAVEGLPGNPVKALYGVLDRWRALFRTEGRPLGHDQLAGLFGELIVLNRLLRKDPSAHRLWRGPQGHRHDFSATAQAIVPYLHDLHDHAQLLNDAIADLRERLASAFEASLLLASARQNDIVKKLASWAAILAVPTAIAGIYGMNFKSMPELDWEFGYPAVLLFIIGLCSFLFYRFKRSGWL